MAATIIERPYIFSFAGNEIRYLFDSLTPANPGCALDVRIYYQDIELNNAPVLLTGFRLVPDANGKVNCPIEDYLSDILSPQLPELDGFKLHAAPAQCSLYYISWREVSDVDPDPLWTDETPIFVLLGGIEKALFKRNNFFFDYLPTAKPFMTWMPDQHFVCLSQPVFLTFFNSSVPVPTDFVVVLKAMYADGTVQTFREPSPLGSLQLLWHIDVSPLTWGLDILPAASPLYYYEVHVEDTVGNILAKPYRYYLDNNPYYSSWDFNYFNSLGGFDNVRVKGEVTIGVDVSAEDREHVLFGGDFTSTTPQQQYSQMNMVKKDVYKGDAGWMSNKAQQDAMTELLISRGRWQIIDGRWIAVINLKKSVDFRTTNDKKYSFPVEWSYGFSDSVYTPQTLRLGAGSASSGPVNFTGSLQWLLVTPVSKGGIEFYNIDWQNVGGIPVNMAIMVSNDGITYVPVYSSNRVTDTLAQYTMNAGTNQSHFVKIIPDGNFSAAQVYHHSTDYSTSFTANTITANSFNIVTGFSAGVTFDVSIDGGVTYAFTGANTTPFTVTGLATATTYQVVRKMYDTSSIPQALPPIAVTTA